MSRLKDAIGWGDEQDADLAPEFVPALPRRMPTIAGGALAWCFVTYGLTLIVTSSKIAAPLRRHLPATAARLSVKLGAFLAALLHCPMCFGFWAGLVLSLLGLRLTGQAVLDGLAASGWCWIAHVTLMRLGADKL